MKETQKVILIESGNWGMEIPTVIDLNYEVIFLSSGLVPYKKEYAEMAFLHIENRMFADFDILKKYVGKLVNRYKVSSIFSTSDFFIYNTARLCEDYNFKFLDFRVAENLLNKGLFRAKQELLGYKVPENHLFRTPEEGVSLIKSSSKKWVFKPLNGNESVGIQLINSEADIYNCFAKLQNLSRYSNGIIISDSYILEEFIEGRVVSCEFIKGGDKLNILGITSRMISSPPNFLELGYVFPCEDCKKNQIYEIVENFIVDFNYNYGPCHMEFIITNDGQIYILEVNPRLIGPPNYWMIDRALGINIIEIICKMYIEGSLKTLSFITEGIATCLEVVTPIQGYLNNLTLNMNWEGRNNILLINNFKGRQYVREATSNKDILLRILTVENDRKKSAELAFEILKSVSLNIDIRPSLELHDL